MGKTSRKTKAKYKDFQKVKLKVGKKLPKGANETTTAFKTRNIQVKGQLQTQSSSQPTTKRKLNINDLLSQCQHYSINIRYDAVTGLRELVSSTPALLQSHLSVILERASELLIDKDGAVRHAVERLLKHIFNATSSSEISPFFPLLSAHLCCAMTHIVDEIRLDSLSVLDLCLEHFPSLVSNSSSQLLPNFIGQISQQTQTSNRKKSTATTQNLIVNPNSKLSTHKWRVKVFGRLHKFLKAILGSRLNQKQDGRVVMVKEVKWACDHEVTTFITGYNSVEQFIGTEFRLSNVSGGTEEDALTENSQLKSFVHTLVPLCLQCWVEASPAYHSDQFPGTSRDNVDCWPLLASILQVLQLLLEYIQERSHEQAEGISLSWWRDTFMKDFEQYFMTQFPYSIHEKPKNTKGKSGRQEQPQVSVTSINLSICDVMAYFIPTSSHNDREAIPQWFSLIMGYVTQNLQTGTLGGEHLQTALLMSHRLLNVHLQEDYVEPLLRGIHMTYQLKHPQSADMRLLLHFLQSDVLDSGNVHLLRFTCIKEWLQSLPELLIKLKGQKSPVIQQLLDIMRHASAMKCSPFLESLQDHLQDILDPAEGTLRHLEPDLQCRLFEVLHNVQLSKEHLVSIATLCHTCVLQCSTIRYLIDLLHHRCSSLHQESNQSTTPKLQDEDYISFLLTLLVGYSRSMLDELEISQLNKDMEQIFQDVHIDLNQERDLFERHWEILQCVCDKLSQFPSQEQMWQLISPVLNNLLCGRGPQHVIPWSTSLALLYATGRLCPSTAGILAAPGFEVKLGRLCGVLLQISVSMEIRGVDAESKPTRSQILHTGNVCASILQRFPDLFNVMSAELGCVVQGPVIKKGAVIDCIKGITQVLQQRSSWQQANQLIGSLTKLKLAVQENYQELHDQWWTDFTYQVSLIK